MNYESILRQYFGYPSFRGIQKEIVESIGSGKDTLGLMPTGGGKSITFQVPALAQEGVCIVITPLISLMKDQVEHLKERNILAAYVNSTMNRKDILQTLDNAIYGGVKFLYISPERIGTKIFQEKLRYMNVCFITVDEAHCISQWGYDFRPAYLKISEIREIIPNAPVLALTATATPEVVEDIQNQLLFREHNVFKMSFKRDNLVYVVRQTEDKLYQIIHILQSVPGSAIVYTRNRQGTKDIARFLCDNGIKATFYHAGLDFAVKDKRQQDWQEDSVRVMVATNAFGMGIDKPDVRIVIHYDCPDSIEAYFQEAGRGGRDGKRSYAVLLVGKGDVSTLRQHASEEFPPKEYIRKVYDHLAYYFQLAIDSGEGASYTFDVTKFCITFKHHPSHLLPALTILQRAGYIEFDAEPDNRPRVKFLLERDELYRLEQVSTNENLVIENLLRCYGNLFVDFAYIQLSYLAMRTGLTEEQIHVTLKSLSHFHIIKYIPARQLPLVYYPMQRVDSSRLRIEPAIYEDLQESSTKRVEAMVNYIKSSDTCRSRLLLKYFGEDSTDCGYCDVCNAKRNDHPQDEVEHTKDLIRELIKKKETASVSDLRNINIPQTILNSAITQMRESGELQLDGSRLILK